MADTLSRMILTPLLLLALGCGGSRPWAPRPVDGKVTYEDGSLIPAKALKLTFTSQATPKGENKHPRPGQVRVNVQDGAFDDVTTYKYADGLIPGKHKVSITARDEKGGLSDLVPEEYRYAHTSPIEIDTADAPLHIKVRKP